MTRGFSRLGWRIFSAAMMLLALSHCRSADKPGVSEIETLSLWYDQAGAEHSCDDAPKSCAVYKDQKSFVDTCVAKGYQAKTCGCLVVCSGKILGFSLVDETTARKADTGSSCAAADETVIKAVQKARVAGSSLDRCLTSHVCNGNLGLCSGADQATSTRMRTLGRQGCSSDVLSTICPEGYQETLSCAEPLIGNLSQTFASLQNKDDGVKRCIRNVICSDNKTGCDEPGYKRAFALKQAINTDGCEYWLRAFCAMGTHAW